MKPFYKTGIRLVVAGILSFLFLFSSCTAGNTDKKSKPEKLPVFSTWSSRNEALPNTRPIPLETALPENAKPWGGTVSHHLLTDALINEWFSVLAAARSDIALFYILSPSHWGLSLYDWALTNGCWDTALGHVASSAEHSAQLSQLLGVPYDNGVFVYEHGVSTLIPYIKQYFPKAQVAVIAYNGEPPVNMQKAEKLVKTITEVFSKNPDEKAFLLISSDFSHQVNYVVTAQRERKTRRFFETRNPDTWVYAVCDNRPAMYVLSRLFTEKTMCTIQRSTNAYELTPKTDPNDITGYFFTYFWEKTH